MTVSEADILGSYDGEVAFVAGAAGGTGPAICRALASLGLSVVAADRDAGALDRVTAELKDAGCPVTSIELDITDQAGVDAAIAGTEAPLAVLVNLAATVENRRFVNMTNGELDRTMASHLAGTLNTSRAAAKEMIARGYGRIINMSSIVVVGAVGAAAYAAAKGAVEALSRTAALELAANGVTVNCVAAGPLATGIFVTQPEENQRRIVASIPMSRPGTADEMGATVAFLASRAAGFITGQSIVLDGGASLGF